MVGALAGKSNLSWPNVWDGVSAFDVLVYQTSRSSGEGPAEEIGLGAMLFTLRESKVRDVGAGLQTRPRADLKVGPYAIASPGSRVAATD